jgi:hypothetical protein
MTLIVKKFMCIGLCVYTNEKRKRFTQIKQRFLED